MNRIVPIDIARGVAVLMMIVAHATDAFLDGAYRTGTAWDVVNISFGFVAPAFLFLSGLVMAAAVDRRRRQPASDDRPLVWRMARLVLLGYWLQIPTMSCRRLIVEQHPDELSRLFDVNVLQIIGITGLLILLIVRCSGDVRRATAVVAVMAVAIAIATPTVWGLSLGAGLPAPLASWLDTSPPTTFPFFPWAFFPLAGFTLSTSVVQIDGARGRITMAAAATVVMALVRLLDRYVELPALWNDMWRSSPLHQLFRLGGVMVLLSVSFLAAPVSRSLREGMAWVGRRSLALYVTHLVFLYGSPATMGGRYWFNGPFNNALGPTGVVLAACIVLGVSVGAVFAWQSAARRFPRMSQWAGRLAWSLFWIIFLLHP